MEEAKEQPATPYDQQALMRQACMKLAEAFTNASLIFQSLADNEMRLYQEQKLSHSDPAKE